MNKSISFTKMQGAGNDFILLDNRNGSFSPEEYPTLASTLCRRRMSLGADGMMFVEKPSRGGDFAMVFYNSDGSLGEMCGNGARCIARYGYDHQLAGDIQKIETTAGMITGWRMGESQYRIRLNDPTVIQLHVPVEIDGLMIDCTYLELGDPGIPHAVVRYDDWDTQPEDALRQLGRKLRYANIFPRGANVTFWKKTDANRAKAITYERGVEDFTLACGTGAGSTAAAMVLRNAADPSGVTLDFPGGTLELTLTVHGQQVTDIYLTGPAVTVAEGTIYLP
jgi:diaminopimelate epimerase